MAKLNDPQHTKVLIIGHSFVKRLSQFLQHIDCERTRVLVGGLRPGHEQRDERIMHWSVNSNLVFHHSEFVIQFHGIGGMKLNHDEPNKALTSKFNTDVINSFNPDLVIIEIGSNDLGSQIVCPEQLARQVVNFASFILNIYSVKRVVLGSVIPRRNLGVPHNDYNNNVHRFNDAVTRLTASVPGVQQWKHRGFTNPERDIFHHNGIHLNFYGNGAFACSLKRAILACKIRDNKDVM